MTIIQTQGVHHITFVGSNRQAIIDFYQGVLGMPLVFEQPNLDVPDELHLYFDPGDGRLITFFVRPTRVDDPAPRAVTAAAFGCLVAAQHSWLASGANGSLAEAIDRAMSTLAPRI